ncbi:MAG TPA: TonB family protein [Steroidobacteraceae bacterium]|nr:TonB family protein [Steroidobacteraceae bacterium]
MRGRSLSGTFNTVSVSPQKQAASEALAGPGPFAGGLRIAERLLLLTHDESLIEALASVVPPESLTVVADEAALAGHLLSGHAGVVFIDVGAAAHSPPGATAQLAQRLHIELPDVVLVVAGDGAAQSELAGLVADGTIYRFVHKPVSAQRVKLFVDAAWRKRDGSSASGMFPALSMPQAEQLTPMPRDSRWLPTTVAVVVLAAVVAWCLLPKNSPTDAASAPQAPVPPTPVPQAPVPQVVEQVIVRPPAVTHLPSAAPIPIPPAPQPQLAAPASSPAPIVAASPATAISATVARAADALDPPTSTPPVSEARDPLSVAAVILQRVYAVDPEFPEVARENDLAGYVDLEFTVHSDGSVSDVTVLKARPVGVFEKPSIAAVSQWRYQPIERDGLPVTEHARLRLNFGYK